MVVSRELLQDLYDHQAWADAEHWRALEAHHAALHDLIIRTRLHHIHLSQRAFLSILRGEMVAMTTPAEFPTDAALKEYGRGYHQEVAAYLKDVPLEGLSATLTIPWFKDPPIRITGGEALLQAAMHSHYHRGQNAAKLRERGGDPPLTDLIVWWWKGRPAANWD